MEEIEGGREGGRGLHVSENLEGSGPVRANGISGELEEDGLQRQGACWGIFSSSFGLI